MSAARDRLAGGYYNSSAASALNPGGFSAGGHVVNFPAALDDVATVADEAAASADAAATSAQAVAVSAATQATSTTSIAIGTGNKTFTMTTGKLFTLGQTLIVSDAANALNNMIGRLTAYNSGTGAATVNVTSVNGSGTKTSWNIGLAGEAGVPATRTVSAGGLVTGGGDLSSNRTLTVTAAVAADVAAGTSSSTAVTPQALAQAVEPATLADASTIAWDMAPKLAYKVTIGGARTLDKPTNFRLGETYVLDVYEDATGGRSLAFHTCYDFGGVTPSMPSTAGARATMTARCIDATAGAPKFDCTWRRPL